MKIASQHRVFRDTLPLMLVDAKPGIAAERAVCISLVGIVLENQMVLILSLFHRTIPLAHVN